LKIIKLKNILIGAALMALAPFAYAQEESVWDYLKPQNNSSRIIKIDKKILKKNQKLNYLTIITRNTLKIS
jgi:hypothetical protein